MDSLQRGDILINTEQHTEIYAGDGKNYGAHSDFDGADGDSSGDEVSLGSYWNDAWDTILRPTGGAGVTIPEQYGNGGYSVTFYTPRGCYIDGCDTAWAAGTRRPPSTPSGRSPGRSTTTTSPTYNGRYLIACTTTYGRVGDKVDFTLSDGTVIKCVIADAKNPNDAGCNEVGHSEDRTSSSSRWTGRASTGAATPAARAGRPSGAASASARPSTAAASSSLLRPIE